MVQINFALKEVNCKVVYYGPGLSGKTTNLEVIHSKAPKQNIGDLTSIATEGDRTLFFDFLPLNLGAVSGMTTKFQIYTVPGQVYYNSTRKLVLQGADGIVFVADSRRGKMDENLESLANLEENLHEYGMDIHSIPLVLQYNKRDMPDVYTVEELDEKLNKYNSPTFEAVAVTGEGVFPTLKKLSQMVIESLNRQQNSSVVRAPRKKRSPADAREPVAVGVGATDASGAQGGGTAAPISRGRSVAGGARGGAVRSRNQHVVREPVSDSPGIKPIERKAPGGNKVVRKRQEAGRGGMDGAAREKKSGKGVLVAAGLVMALAAAGAVAYFLGLFGN